VTQRVYDSAATRVSFKQFPHTRLIGVWINPELVRAIPIDCAHESLEQDE
jgi:hypothetical protein